MENLIIASTKRTPEVEFNIDGRFKISGRSIPEDASQFYDRLYEWVFHFCQESHISITFDIILEYFNSGSSKAILDILRALVGSTKVGKQININWYYEEGDDDILERGEYFESILNVKFNFIETD